jgi:hypothetical protein
VECYKKLRSLVRLFHRDRADKPEELEVSHMERTEVTVGDLEQLCETSLMEREEESSGHTPASVESHSRTITEKSVNDLLDQASGATDPEGREMEGAAGPLASPFVTTRNEHSITRSIDDVFLDGESESFKRQVQNPQT